MRRIHAAACFVLCSSLVALVACKDEEKRPPAATDIGQSSTGGVGAGGREGGAGDGAADSGSDAAQVCNDLTNDGDAVDQNRIVGDAPTGTGGQIADGTYELTQADVYVGSGTPGLSGVTYKGVLRVSNGATKLERITSIQANQGATPIETRVTGDVLVVAPNLTVTETCPAPFKDQFTYSVLNNTLNLTTPSTGESFTFTLR